MCAPEPPRPVQCDPTIPTILLEHIDTVTIASREERDNPVSMWTTSGYHLGRASVKLVFIENCQMVICKYLCKMFWKLCNSIYRNIVKSLLHITFQTFPSIFKRRGAFLVTLKEDVHFPKNTFLLVVLGIWHITWQQPLHCTLLLCLFWLLNRGPLKKEGNLKCFKSYC